jgi:hypothetical protein
MQCCTLCSSILVQGTSSLPALLVDFKKERYEKLEPVPQRAQSKARRGIWQRDLDSICMTTFEAAFQSAACVRLACEHGLQAHFNGHLLQHQAGRVADLTTLIAAQELGLRVTDKFMNSTAYCGHVDVLELLRAQGVPLPEPLSLYAAANARIDVLRWLQSTNTPLDKVTAVAAARRGHLDVLQFLRATDCPWSDTIANEAAVCGSVEVMRWLREQDAVISTKNYAASS